MRTILIIEENNESSFKNYLVNELGLLHIEYKILGIKDLNREHSDYMVLNSIKNKNKKLKLDTSYCIANMDSNLSKNIIIQGNVITYGLGSKNTVTVSSLEDNNMGYVYCLQRYLKLESGDTLEPQEIPTSLNISNDTELYASMVAITIALIEGIQSSDIEKKLSKKLLVST
jgi:hypothetical protein